jgi:hypothetical protein
MLKTSKGALSTQLTQLRSPFDLEPPKLCSARSPLVDLEIGTTIKLDQTFGNPGGRCRMASLVRGDSPLAWLGVTAHLARTYRLQPRNAHVFLQLQLSG